MLSSLKPCVHCLMVLVVLITALFWRPNLLLAQDGADLSELLEGFDETDAHLLEADLLEGFEDSEEDFITTTQASAVPDPLIPLEMRGDVTMALGYNYAHEKPSVGKTDWRGVSRLTAELFLEGKLRLPGDWQMLVNGKGGLNGAYALKGRHEFTPDVIGDDEDELALGELYLQGSLTDDIDLKVGRQIIVWGKSDNIRITDVLNPLDLREPGITDIEDLRLPVTMTRIDYYLGVWNFSGMALHEVRFNKTPPYGSDFFPGATPLPPEEIPESTPAHTQFAAALNGVFSGWDLSLYFADIYQDTPRFENRFPLQTRLVHDRIQMIGMATNVARGNWLVKGEGAWFNGLQFFNGKGDTFSRLDLLAGLEYTGFSETSIALEMANRHLYNFSNALKAAPDGALEDDSQLALRFTKEMLNNTLTWTLLAAVYGTHGENGGFQRCAVDYDLTDSIVLRAGFTAYQSGDKAQMQAIGDNDRIFLEAKFSF
jgi:hypothetical protein